MAIRFFVTKKRPKKIAKILPNAIVLQHQKPLPTKKKHDHSP